MIQALALTDYQRRNRGGAGAEPRQTCRHGRAAPYEGVGGAPDDGYVEAGLTPAQALQSATREAGRTLGDDGLGVVRQHAYTDLGAVEGDPTLGLAPLRAPHIVIKGGRVVAGDGVACAPR